MPGAIEDMALDKRIALEAAAAVPFFDTAKAQAEKEEDEEAGDMDKPLPILSGMGEEEVHKVTLKEVSGDMDDPPAMLNGMGNEEVCKASLTPAIVHEAFDIEEWQYHVIVGEGGPVVALFEHDGKLYVVGEADQVGRAKACIEAYIEEAIRQHARWADFPVEDVPADGVPGSAAGPPKQRKSRAARRKAAALRL